MDDTVFDKAAEILKAAAYEGLKEAVESNDCAQISACVESFRNADFLAGKASLVRMIGDD